MRLVSAVILTCARLPAPGALPGVGIDHCVQDAIDCFVKFGMKRGAIGAVL